jgi:hypothetical protein
MQTTQELDRRPSPAAQPHPLTYRDGFLWMGSRVTDRIYAIDPKTWSVHKEFETPGKPYGITTFGDELRVVIAHGEEEDRYLYRLIPDRGFDLESKTACPDFTGSYIAAQGSTIYLGQLGLHRILLLNSDATVQREIPMETRFAGLAFGPGGDLYIISADEEFENLKFGTLDVAQSPPRFESIRPLPDAARSIAYDGTRWWTCLRDEDEIASFSA